MASNPPLQVEDQTDEDFFDKLVDDDDEFKVTASSTQSFADGNDSDEVKAFANLSIGEVAAQSFADGNDSDEAKAFANLSIGEVAAGSEDLGGEGVSEAKGKATGGDDVNAVAVDGHVDESSSLVPANSFGADTVIESNGEAIGTEGTTDSIISKCNESPGSGVKEIQWTAFGFDAGQNGGNGFGSYSDFFSELGDGTVDPTAKTVDNFITESKIGSGDEEFNTTNDDNNYNYGQYQESQASGEAMGQNADGQDLNSSQYWENLYPGWKYDLNTGQWYQVDGDDATGNVQGRLDFNSTGGWAASDGNSQVSYLKQTAQSFVGAVNVNGTTESISNWNQVSQQGGSIEGVSNQVSMGNNEYAGHMVFDPQYPGWYYDTIAEEWRLLETYTSSPQSEVQALGHSSQHGFTSTGTFSQIDNKKTHGSYGQVENYVSQGFGAQSRHNNWSSSFSNYNQQGLKMWQPDSVSESEAPAEFSGNRHWVDDYGSKFSTNTHVNQQESYDSWGTIPFSEKATQGHHGFATGSQGFISSGNINQQVDQLSMQQNKQVHVPKDYYGSQNSVNFSQQQFQSSQQFSHLSSNVGRSSAGRPPHALVTFGFGGKLIVMKDNSSLSTSSYGNQGSLGGFISVLNLVEVVTEKIDPSIIGPSSFDYFNTLCGQSFPGPIVGGSVGNKELNKWVDERISSCESAEMDYRKAEVLRLLLSLLKIACQYYGKLRSPFGTDPGFRESEVPETAVAKLFASAKKNGKEFGEYGTLAHCLQKLPSEGQMQATAAEVQSLLVSGRKKEALHCASKGRLWGPALVLAAQLGDQFYVDTVKQMALCQLVAGSPLRTLCLLIAGQPAEVFSTYTSGSNIPGAVNVPPQPAQYGANYMLDDWEENLAVITANRTKDDELVLIHLGDCLWKERSEIIAAHICYLVAEANFEPYSDSARLCLIGADHWKFPRTYASPDAIQRTELYEYSKVLGNPQFILLSFQPYKLIYAHMLAEVGKVTDSLKYCQAISKSLKTGRASEVDTWRQLASSLEERIRTYQQGGYSANLAPGKLVGKLLNLFDSTAHRVVGGLPPPVPSTSQGGAQTNEHNQTMVPRVSTSQSTMAMSSLMPSASMEPMNEWTVDGNRMKMHNRSVSEPDFGRTPIQHQVDSAKEATSSYTQGKASVSGRTSRFGRFSLGSQLLQKTVGLLRPRQDRQAKLGEENRFYYDEKLKRWVEEGAEPPAEEAALPPPPPTTALQNGTLDYNLRSAMKSENSATNGNPEFTRATPLEQSSGIPPIPPATNQFSARGRTGVRSRYVDTFNKGGGNPTNLFQSPSAQSIKPAASGSNPKFFVPTPVSSSEQGPDTTITQNTIPSMNDSFDSLAPTPPTTAMQFQRFPSMDNISNKERTMKGNGPLSSHSRRTASWSGSFNGEYNSPHRTEAKPLEVGSFSTSYNSPPQTTEVKSLGEVLGMLPPTNDGSFGDDLQEVEL